ncbi:probable 39S ribosomal protein L49, mitochondrial [Toxorhynchites rutilus septentrionalis]|uniref:probable 39S ribosomal protein L49, mitochondrial n=1 Tax=Toxorhynchites rutilus septentrionalis TaxID=329112 RepID=UPI00247891FF|nr:probable 39S ribosomal protein L49, mitochondrial [Toxorhynchites rutilus septentrionalis]
MLARALSQSFPGNSLFQQFACKNLLQNVTVLNIKCTRDSSFRSSEPVGDLNQYQNAEVVKNPPEWKYIERLISPRVIPKPLSKATYPSGWKPPKPDVDLKYFVPRTKNYMLPVYLRRTFRGQRIVTALRRVDGDIWQLEAELRYLIEKKLQKQIVTRVNEMNGLIEFKGDYVTIIKDYLHDKGL